MNRSELQRLAEDRAIDAKILLDAGRWSGAYYLGGYAVECGLKSCVLAHIGRTGVLFVDPSYASRCWTHDVEERVRLADLEAERGKDISACPARGINWARLKDWKEISRYQQKSEARARDFHEAIVDGINGVLTWIKNYW